VQHARPTHDVFARETLAKDRLALDIRGNGGAEEFAQFETEAIFLVRIAQIYPIAPARLLLACAAK
jgi:hypothetical protein